MAVEVARATGASLHVLNVLEPNRESGGVHASDPLAWEIDRREGKAYLEEIRERLSDQGVRAELLITEGVAADRILERMSSLPADLTVLCRHGEHG